MRPAAAEVRPERGQSSMEPPQPPLACRCEAGRRWIDSPNMRYTSVTCCMMGCAAVISLADCGRCALARSSAAFQRPSDTCTGSCADCRLAPPPSPVPTTVLDPPAHGLYPHTAAPPSASCALPGRPPCLAARPARPACLPAPPACLPACQAAAAPGHWSRCSRSTRPWRCPSPSWAKPNWRPCGLPWRYVRRASS